MESPNIYPPRALLIGLSGPLPCLFLDINLPHTGNPDPCPCPFDAESYARIPPLENAAVTATIAMWRQENADVMKNSKVKRRNAR